MPLSTRPARQHTHRFATIAAASALVTGVALIAAQGPAVAAPKPITDRASVTTGGFHPGHGSSGARRPTERRLVSDDGRFVVFESPAPFAKGQSTLQRLIVLRDRKLGTSEVVSRNAAGKLPNASVHDPSISANGRWITYISAASNLVPGDTNGVRDVFRHDTRTRQTTNITRDANHRSGPTSISADGRYVAFLSESDGLAPGDEYDLTQAYLHDTVTGETELVSVKTSGAARSALPETSVSVSADGQRVLFESVDQDLAPGAGTSDRDIFLRDRVAGTTTKVAGNEDGAHQASISADGRFAVYESTDPDIVPGDTNDARDIFVVDLDTLEHTLVSKSSGGAFGNAGSERAGISADGRFVVFESTASNLVPGDTNGEADVFRHDLLTGKTIRMNVRSNGSQVADGAGSPAISGDGQHVVFESHARNLTRQQTGTWGQVFVRDLSGAWPVLIAKVAKLPKKVKKNKTVKVKTSGIAQGQRLTVVWQPKGKTGGKKVVRTVPVTKDRITTKAGPRRGTYTVTVRYADRQLRKQVVRTR